MDNIASKLRQDLTIGNYFTNRFRKRLKEVMKTHPNPHYVVAKQLRKMGVPLEITLCILCKKG